MTLGLENLQRQRKRAEDPIKKQRVVTRGTNEM